MTATITCVCGHPREFEHNQCHRCGHQVVAYKPLVGQNTRRLAHAIANYMQNPRGRHAGEKPGKDGKQRMRPVRRNSQGPRFARG